MKNMKKSSEICERKKKRTSHQKSAGSVHPNIVVVKVPWVKERKMEFLMVALEILGGTRPPSVLSLSIFGFSSSSPFLASEVTKTSDDKRRISVRMVAVADVDVVAGVV